MQVNYDQVEKKQSKPITFLNLDQTVCHFHTLLEICYCELFNDAGIDDEGSGNLWSIFINFQKYCVLAKVETCKYEHHKHNIGYLRRHAKAALSSFESHLRTYLSASRAIAEMRLQIICC